MLTSLDVLLEQQKGLHPKLYKFSVDEGEFASDLIAVMDQAVADGFDMICISYGWRFIPIYEDTITIVAFGAMAKGVLVSASVGNHCPVTKCKTQQIFTVASGHSDCWFSGTLTMGNGLKIKGWSLFPARAIIDNWSVIYNKTVSACDSAELLAQEPDAGRSIIICQRSADADEVSTQMNSVAEARLGAAIFIDFPNPGVVIIPKEGKQVLSYVTKTIEPKASISFLETHLDSKSAPVVSGSSARGPSRSYLRVAKPDILAPGVLILAAWPSNAMAAKIGANIELATDYLLESGTSMASPHIAGIAAMVKGAHPDWSPSAIRSAMMTTANPLDNTQKPIRNSEDNKPATPLDMGAGHVDPNRALDPGLIYDTTPEDNVNLLFSLNFTEEQFKTIARSSANHNCSNPSSDINYPSFIAFFSPEGNFTWLEQKFRRTVTNVGSAASTYRVKVKAPRNSTVSVSPQTLVFKKKNQRLSSSLTIRYRDDAEQKVQSGSITWVEDNGNHTVRSPIVISPEIETW
ncbi:putative RNA polymerase sigma factor sigD, chloroplastic-like [Capsicum annuum]|nr:putative RNA polymerase sigma factor sigD, chloroplastic-like [Capsicum annuum]